MTRELLPCPFCGHHAVGPIQVWGDAWGKWDWRIACSSSHCHAEVRIIADGWQQQLDANLNKHIPQDELYDDRLQQVVRKWNRRAALSGVPQRDAERYRFWQSHIDEVDSALVDAVNHKGDDLTADDFDATIDQAMLHTAPQEER